MMDTKTELGQFLAEKLGISEDHISEVLEEFVHIYGLQDLNEFFE